MPNMHVETVLKDFQFAEDDKGRKTYSGLFFTEAETVLRFSFWSGLYRLQISADPADWDTSRVGFGTTSWSYDHGDIMVGTVDQVTIGSGGGRFTGHFVRAVTPQVEQVQANIEDGDLKGLSMEIFIGKTERLERNREKGDLYRGKDIQFFGMTSIMRPAFGKAGVGFAQDGQPFKPEETNRLAMQELLRESGMVESKSKTHGVVLL